ncbi:restriction endonuclease [Paenibacillus wynnii]|uniref:restriction endonuclease n=1 Tax=Paenibacillus wynnii TaxID=268407 RepID=UPI00278FA9BA|nr:restriction endonuclease [Paenibacillus wynnii]MDQ0196865.1 restriction system protein [Paenibacillus wynnii]
MARRKSKAKQEEEFFEGLAGIAAMAFGFVGFMISKSLYGVVVGVILGLAMVFSIMRYIGNKRAERLKMSGIDDIDKMDGVQFEKYLGHLLRAQGYKAEVTKAAGDYGADLLIQKDGKKIVVQAKRYSKNVGIKAVQEAQAAIAHYGATEAWVISNSDYTTAAYDLANSNRVKLINREALIEMILAMNPGAVPTPNAIIIESPVAEMICPKCGSKLVLRSGARGQFYGCSSFPKCRHIRSITAV